MTDITDEMVEAAMQWTLSRERAMRIIAAVAPLIRAQERERCAKVADGWRREEELDRCCDRAQNDCAEDIAQHIRALAQPVSEPGEQT